MPLLSRRKLADNTASRIAAGEPKKVVLKELAAYLIDTKRVHEAQLIVRDVETALALRGTVVATVTSARALSADALREIKDYVSQQYSATKQVIVREQIDEALLGGVKVDMPGKALDISVKAKLDKLTV